MKISKMQSDLIAWDFHSGHKCRDLAQDYGVDFTRISQIGRSKGVKGRAIKGKYRSKIKTYHPDCIAWDYYCTRNANMIAKDYEIDRSRVHQIVKQKRVPIRRVTCDESVFDTITPESAYWIGFLTADGCITGWNNHTVAICLGIKDIGHLLKFKRFLKTNASITYNDKKASIAVSSKRIVDRLSDFGIVHLKTFIAYVPDELKDNRDYWRGVIDGDGTVWHKTSSMIVTVCGTLAICDAFKNYCKQLVRTQANVLKCKDKNLYTFKIEGTNFAIQIIKDLYYKASVFLERKYQTACLIMDAYHERVWG